VSHLQDILDRLEQEDPNLVLLKGWKHPHSYRGYYSELGVEPCGPTEVRELIATLKGAIGSTFQGWKGGDYTMHEYVEVYLAEQGCVGEALTVSWLDLLIQLSKSEPTRVASVLLFKPEGKYYTKEQWRIPTREEVIQAGGSAGDSVSPFCMRYSPDFRRISGGPVLVESQEPWGYPHLLVSR
jgi:hypothetical protein